MPSPQSFDDFSHPQPRRRSKVAPARRSSGCGCLSLTALSVLIIIAVVGALSMLSIPQLPSFNKQPIPDNVPPAAAAPPPMIDIDAPGRTSDQLQQWAEELSETTRIPAPALRAYGNAAVIAATSYPQCNLSWNTLAGLGQIESGTVAIPAIGWSRRVSMPMGWCAPPLLARASMAQVPLLRSGTPITVSLMGTLNSICGTQCSLFPRRGIALPPTPPAMA